jgi:hypothetical protein
LELTDPSSPPTETSTTTTPMPTTKNASHLSSAPQPPGDEVAKLAPLVGHVHL